MERKPAVAGSFYPGDHALLTADLDEYLNEDRDGVGEVSHPFKALIVPHAGYIYSGSVASSAYRLLRGQEELYDRVILLGPSHFVPFSGHALPRSRIFKTPIRPIEIDTDGVERLSELPHVIIDDAPHAREHSLEVQLPFLQQTIGTFTLLPVAVGMANASDTADLIESEWDREGTLTIISTDLSHYLSWEEARARDEETAQAVETLSRTNIRPEEACGCHPLNGIIEAARRNGLTPRRLDLRNSGDTSGDKSRVVGYGAWIID